MVHTVEQHRNMHVTRPEILAPWTTHSIHTSHYAIHKQLIS